MYGKMNMTGGSTALLGKTNVTEVPTSGLCPLGSPLLTMLVLRFSMVNLYFLGILAQNGAISQKHVNVRVKHDVHLLSMIGEFVSFGCQRLHCGRTVDQISHRRNTR